MQRVNYCALIAISLESLTDLLFKSAMIPSNIPLQHCRVLTVQMCIDSLLNYSPGLSSEGFLK